MSQHRLRQRLLAAAATSTILVSLAACGSSDAAEGVAKGFDGTINIGEIDSLTGAQADRAAARVYGLKAGINYVNKQGGIEVDGKTYKLNLVFEDSRGDVAAATSAAAGMVQDQDVKIIFGSGSQAEIKAVSAVVAESEALQLVSTSSLSTITKPGDGLFDYTFGMNVATSDLLPAFVRMLTAVLPDANSVSFLFDELAGAPLAPAIAATAGKNGLEVRTNLLYSTSATDFAAPLTEVRGTGADVLWFGSNPELDATLIKQAGELNAARLYVSFDQSSIAPPKGVGAPFLSVGAGGIYTSNASEARQEFAKVLADSNPDGKAPLPDYTAYSAGSFAGVLMLKQAMEASGSIDDGAAIKDALNKADVTIPGGDHFQMNSETHQVAPLIDLSSYLVGPDGKRELIEFSPDGSKIVSRTAAP